MNDPASPDRAIVCGIRLSATGEVRVERTVGRVLFDLAIRLEEQVPFPVDVQHVVAALVLAAQQHLLDPKLELSPDDETLMTILARYVRVVFEKYDGKLSEDD
ncbi:MAG: hypothetical protein ACO1RT_18140 [Planctomycetaceae bacterium]